MRQTRNIAAMGFSGLYPENTLIAFQKALEAGANGLEVDAHLTKDNVVVLSHDEIIDRTTDGQGRISDYTYKELCTFNAAHQFMRIDSTASVSQLFVSKPRSEEQAAPFGFQAIPRLEELIELVKDLDVFIIVELKGTAKSYPGMGQLVAEIIVDHGMETKSSISSFDHHYIHELSIKNPTVAFAAVTTVDELNEPGAYLTQVNARQIHPYYSAVTPAMVKSCHDHGIEVIVWSIGETDQEEGIAAMMALGVDGVMTHFPNRFL